MRTTTIAGGDAVAGLALTVEGGAALDHRAWEARSAAVARGLATRDLGLGSRVGLLFGARHWADFAVAYLGVRRAGAVPVLLSPGAAPADLTRAVAHAGAAVVLGPADVADLERPSAAAGAEIDQPAAADVGYPPAPMSPPQPWSGDVPDVGVAVDGWLVHTWAPGSRAGQLALRRARAGDGPSATLDAFDPERLCALVHQRRAAALGLTPALAAALLASGALDVHDVSTVTHVVLSGPASPAAAAGLRAAFPGAALTEMDGPRPRTAGAPVAVSQEAMLWHEQFTPGSFNLPCLVRRYRGPLVVAALEGALAELVRRHEPLRSTFALVDGEPRQVIGDPAAFTVAQVDVSDLAAGERDAQVARLLADATGRPFDLVDGPLFEPRIVRLGPDDHLLVVRLHHTVFDDWSVDVFRRELSALYTALVAGAPSPLVEPRTSFTDYCRRLRPDQRAWWGTELDGGPLAVQLPIAGEENTGEPLRVDLPPALAAGVRALAPQLRATTFMTVLAAFSVLLAKVTGQDDLVIATVVAHRDGSDLEPLIGCFTKKVPLRLRTDGNPTFGQVVARTRASLLNALAHQDVAFDAAVQEGLGGPAADHGVVPQVAVVFQGETPQQVKLAMPGLSIGPYDVGAEARRERHFSAGPEKAGGPVWGDGLYVGSFLILSLLETTDGLALVARGVFDRPAAARLLEDFEALLAGAVAGPNRPLSELAAGARTAAEPDTVELRGFRASRPRIEAALGRCPGVADVAVAVRPVEGSPLLIAYVVVEGGHRPPALAELRRTLWAPLPGALWPAGVVVVDALPRRGDGRLDVAGLPLPDRSPTLDPGARVLTAMWGEIAGRPVDPRQSYWQDFSFLAVLAEAREAGIVIDDEHVARCRTPEMLAAAHPFGS